MIKALRHDVLIAKKAYLQEASNAWLIEDDAHNPELSSLPWSRRDDCDACVNVMKREEFKGSGHTRDTQYMFPKLRICKNAMDHCTITTVKQISSVF
jgi:hypothetical protein